MRLEETKTMYQGEWIAFRAVDESDNPEGDVILHNKDRRTFDKQLIERRLTNVYITFTGPIIPEGYGTLFQAPLKVIGYDPAVASERHETITANGVIEVPKLRVERIAIGDAEVGDVEVICHDIPELAGIRGLLGLSFLKHFRTVIDYRARYVEIS